jgi:enoyl-[acyl-carrier-protein] reductase (NADH)
LILVKEEKKEISNIKEKIPKNTFSVKLNVLTMSFIREQNLKKRDIDLSSSSFTVNVSFYDIAKMTKDKTTKTIANIIVPLNMCFSTPLRVAMGDPPSLPPNASPSPLSEC